MYFKMGHKKCQINVTDMSHELKDVSHVLGLGNLHDT